jgi:hypothetical protein
MVDEPSLPQPGPPRNTDPDLEASLDRALAAFFRAPAVPSDLHARVVAAVARDRDLKRTRHDLEKDYRIAIANLNARYLRRGRDVLLASLTIGMTNGLAVRPLSQWLTPFFAGSAPMAAGLMALGMGLFLGAILMHELVGPAPGRSRAWRVLRL